MTWVAWVGFLLFIALGLYLTISWPL